MSTTKKLTRHEIKEPDPFLVWVEHAITYYRTHRQQLLGGVVVLAAVGIMAMIAIGQARASREESSLALTRLLETARRPVGTTSAASTSVAEEPFATQIEKDEAVSSESQALMNAHSGDATGRAAKMLQAQILTRRGEFEKAAVLFGEVAGAGAPTDALAAAAAIARAETRAANGELEPAINDLKTLAAVVSEVLPSELVLLRAAKLAEDGKLDGEALSLYQRLVLEASSPGIRGQAEAKAAELESRTSSSSEAVESSGAE